MKTVCIWAQAPRDPLAHHARDRVHSLIARSCNVFVYIHAIFYGEICV